MAVSEDGESRDGAGCGVNRRKAVKRKFVAATPL